jgi:hypothetical protein
MPGQSTRARDVRITVRVNGVDKKPMALDSATFTFGISTEEVPTIGDAIVALEEIAGPCSLQLECRSKKWVHDLVYAARQRALGNPDYADMQISATFAADFKGEGLSRYRMPDCAVSDATTNVSGNEKVTSSVTLMDGDFKPA